MVKPSIIKIVVVGTVTGLLGASAQSATIALLDADGIATTTFPQLLNQLLSGALLGVAWAAVYRFMPPVYWLQLVIVWALSTSVTWLGVFVRNQVPFSTSTLSHSLVGNLAYAVVASFTLHQAILLALPLVPMSRRADEFSDSPSGA